MFPHSYPESLALVLHEQRAKELIEAANRHRLAASAVQAPGESRRARWVKHRWDALRRLVSGAEPAVPEPVAVSPDNQLVTHGRRPGRGPRRTRVSPSHRRADARRARHDARVSALASRRGGRDS